MSLALVVDLLFVVVFTVIGHWTHAKNLEISGIIDTAWPFVVALVLAWVLNAVWVAPAAPLRTGVGLWATTVLLAMVLRAVIGEGTAGTFIIVAASFNFVTLVGWRVVTAASRSRTRV